MSGCFDIFENYAELNESLGLEADARLTDDRNAEDPALIVGARKWSWDGFDESGPTWPLSLGLVLAEHLPIFDKYDVFIYTR